MSRPESAGRFRVVALVWGAWTGLALLFTLYVMLPSPAAGNAAEWARATAWQLITWWSWAAGTPLVVAVARRLVPMRPPYRLLAAHLAAGVALAGLCTAFQGALRWMAFSGVRTRFDIAGAGSMPMADEWSFNLVVYAMVVGVFYVLRAGRLEAQLARAHLDALSARLRPHFLFNTLNTIAALVPDDPRAANRMIARLAELLRQVFDRGDQAEVPLEEELQLLGHYVAIQHERFGDRLRVTFDVPPSANRGLVPALLFQPLVENALSHGLAGAHGTGDVAVHVEARRLGNRLRLIVRDEGPGFGAAEGKGQGVGLAGTRARLTERYGAQHSVELANQPGGGAVVAIEIPFVADAGPDR